MCLIGLLVPLERKRRKSRRHKSRSSASGHRRAERSRAEQPQQQEKDDLRVLSLLSEDALARLHMSLEQGIVEEQLRGLREHEALDRLRRADTTLGCEREGEYSEAAPPYYSVCDNAARPPPTPEPRVQTGVPDSPECKNRDSAISDCGGCCCCCCCSHRACAGDKCPTLAELDEGRG